MTKSNTTPDRDLLRQLPKAELHCHLDGSVRPQTMLELGEAYHADMPRRGADALAEYMTVRDARNLEEYLARFEVTLSVMQTAEALERIAFELVEDAHRDGVWYLETRFSPVLNTRDGLTPDDAVDAVLRGLARGEQEFGVTSRAIVCALRQLSPAVSLDLARLAVARAANGVAGFDLAGAELGYSATRHESAFAFAHAHDMACTCHAGEGDGAGSVREAVHVCGADRIGHGTRLFEDPALMHYVNDRRIPVETCLTSNVQTHAAASYEEHPVRQYVNAGINVVLSTDNRLMSGTTLTDEYAHAARIGFTFEELSRLALNGFESAFLPWEVRQDLLAKARVAIETLTNGREAA